MQFGKHEETEMAEEKPGIAKDADSKEKPWRCPYGHILGTVYRRNKIRRLRICVNKWTVVVTGHAEVICPVCGQARHWYPGAEVLSGIKVKA